MKWRHREEDATSTGRSLQERSGLIDSQWPRLIPTFLVFGVHNPTTTSVPFFGGRQTSPLPGQLIRRRGMAQQRRRRLGIFILAREDTCPFRDTCARVKSHPISGLGRRGKEPRDRVRPTSRYHQTVPAISEEPTLCHTSTTQSLLRPIRARVRRPIP